MKQTLPLFTRAKTPEEAVAASGEFRAGGTDLVERRHTGVAHGILIDIQDMLDLKRIERDATGATRIGTLVSIAAIAADPVIQSAYPGLSQAAAGLATPQIRAMATIGGSLLQRTRCWYYRHPAFACYKKGGDACPARGGEHHHGVCFDRGPCVFPHPSTLGMALLAYEAQVAIHGQEARSIAALYGDGSDPTCDHMLIEHELLTHILLQPPMPGERAVYLRAISRAAAEWPLVEVIARVVLDERQRIQFIHICAGGVAPVPLRLLSVEEALQGAFATPDVLERAPLLAAEGANPLPGTKYKVVLLTGAVQEALERVVQM